MSFRLTSPFCLHSALNAWPPVNGNMKPLYDINLVDSAAMAWYRRGSEWLATRRCGRRSAAGG